MGTSGSRTQSSSCRSHLVTALKMSSLMLRGLYRQTGKVVRPEVTQRATLVSGAPRFRIPFWEKATVGTLMAIGCMAPIMYIMRNLKYYNGKYDTYMAAKAEEDALKEESE